MGMSQNIAYGTESVTCLLNLFWKRDLFSPAFIILPVTLSVSEKVHQTNIGYLMRKGLLESFNMEIVVFV